jgi:peptidoglycan/LPS O-acetylase OafA/YrhL
LVAHRKEGAAVWTELAAGGEQNAGRAARLLVLAIFVGLAWLVTVIARNRRHPHQTIITILAWAFVLGIMSYILIVRPVERWSIWALVALGYGILVVWSSGGGSAPGSE